MNVNFYKDLWNRIDDAIAEVPLLPIGGPINPFSEPTAEPENSVINEFF